MGITIHTFFYQLNQMAVKNELEMCTVKLWLASNQYSRSDHRGAVSPGNRYYFSPLFKKNGNGKYLLLFLLWVFWMKTTVTRPSLLKSSTVEKYASSDSKWVADSRGDSPKRKIKKFKILHERNYIESNYEWGMPKVMANLKNGTFSNYIQEIKKKHEKIIFRTPKFWNFQKFVK